MEPLSADDAKYFFIVSQFSRLVLDISPGKTNFGNLIVKKKHGGPSQLWRWDEGCRLVSKLGLVADIKGKSKKEGAVCHAWKAHDGLNQKWRVEEGAIESNLSHLVIDCSPPKAQVFMRNFEEKEYQKWYFIPENAWDDFQDSLKDPDPLNKALFWKHLADNYLDVIIGYSFDEYEVRVNEAFEIIDACSSSLNEVARGTGIAGTVGGSASVVGGGMSIAGLLLAPVTAGVSLGLTVAGAITGVAGSATALTGSLVNDRWDKKKAKKVNETTASLFRATYSLHSLLGQYSKYLQGAAEYLETPQGKAVTKEAYKVTEVARATGNVASKVYDHAKEIKRLVSFIKADSFVLKGADIGISTNAAAPGITVPILGKTLVAAGSTGAKALSGSLAGFGVLIGIFEIFGGAKKIVNGSQLADEFRQSSECLRTESARLIRLYKELHKNEDGME